MHRCPTAGLQVHGTMEKTDYSGMDPIMYPMEKTAISADGPRATGHPYTKVNLALCFTEMEHLS